jgi:type IV secretory pathway VirB10-like protein
LQEYCLECGSRLPVERGAIATLGTAWRRRLRWYPGDWIWPALLLLLLAALAGVIAYLTTSDHQKRQTIVATTQAGTPPPTTTAPATPTAPATTAPPAPPAATTTTATPPPPPPPPATPGALVSWPAGKSGYTTVLQSIPTRTGKAAAVAIAKRASNAGLAQVGYLNSSAFSSLHPGYYVVFSGIYNSFGAAQTNAATATSSGFSGAYVRQITP